MKRNTLFFIALFLMQTAIAQTYYKKIKYDGGHFSSPIPRDYYVYITGPVDAGDNFVKLTITGGVTQTLEWKRGNSNQTEFEVLMAPLTKGVDYKFKVEKSASGVGVAKGSRLFSDDNNGDIPEDENHGTRWGIVAGAGYTFLGRGENKDGDIFGHVAAKFYPFAKLDKTRKFLDDNDKNIFQSKVYEEPYQRFSIIAGGAVSPLAYKGKELTGPIYSVKPMIGIGFDFSPEISVDGGAIFFDYQKGNSSLYSDLEKKVGMGLFVTISLDIDVFTRLRTAFTNQHYNQTLR